MEYVSAEDFSKLAFAVACIGVGLLLHLIRHGISDALKDSHSDDDKKTKEQ